MKALLSKKCIYFVKKNNILSNWWKDYAFITRSNFVHVVRSICLIGILSTQSANPIHASGEISFKAWIDFIEEDSTAFVKGLFVNLTDKEEIFDWEMTLQKESLAGKLNEVFNGSFTAKPSIPTMIADVDVDLKKREYFVIILNVFDKKKALVGTDTLTSELIDPSLKPLPPKSPILANVLKKPRMNLDALEIDGLILDETRTKIGRDFYEYFFNKWIPPSGAKDFLITIKELPSRGIGARVSIEVNDNVVLSRFLQPRGDIVEEQALVSIRAIRRHLEQAENLKKSIDSADVSGSGIY